MCLMRCSLTISRVGRPDGDEGCAVVRIERFQSMRTAGRKSSCRGSRIAPKALAEHIGLRRRLGLSGAHRRGSVFDPCSESEPTRKARTLRARPRKTQADAPKSSQPWKAAYFCRKHYNLNRLRIDHGRLVQCPARAADLGRDRHDRRPSRGMFMFFDEHQLHGSLAHFRGKPVRCLAHDGSTFSGVGAFGKPGAVQIEGRRKIIQAVA